MIVKILSFGSNWWMAHSRNMKDPLCFRRHCAYFNSACLFSGRRLRFCWIFPGQVRFNANSEFNPEFRQRMRGRSFIASGPRLYRGRTHLLFQKLVDNGIAVDAFLVTLNNELHGNVDFKSAEWKSEDARPISISARQERFECMVLLGYHDWIRTDVGSWIVNPSTSRLELATASVWRGNST